MEFTWQMSRDAYDWFEKNALQIISRQMSLRMSSARKIAREAADAELNRLFPVIASKYMGKRSKPNIKAFQPYPWQPLAESTVAKKGHDKYWTHTGEMQDYFSDLVATRVFGKTKVVAGKVSANDLRRGSRRKMTIEILPFGGTDLLRTVDLELELDYDLAGRKLRGELRYFRPLLEPAMVHWLNVRMPQAVKRALRKAGFEVSNVKLSV